jgi:acetyl-CoA carboxylase biotin carboxyl carrier protein
MDLTNDDVADILALLDSLPYDSLDVETPRFRLTLRRAAGGGWTSESRVLAEPTVVTPTPPTAPVPNAGTAPGGSGGSGGAGASGSGSAAGVSAADTDAAPAAGSDGLVPVVTSLPGTFYRAPRPGAAPFVEVGDAVAADTVVAIVETMKLMNSVHAGTAGRVARICLDNGEFAPLGTTLILIEPEP